jgi:Tol biopolymer transport system component
VHRTWFRIVWVLPLLVISITGCQSSTASPVQEMPTDPAVLTPELPEIIVPPDFPIPSPLPTQVSDTQTMPASAVPLPEETATLLPTLDLRLPPENWQSWPVVPTRISDRMREIYFQGLARGNDPHAFSKIGDCQSVTASFLGFFDMPGRYTLGEKYQPLQSTIDYFAGSFVRESQAVRGGFNVASVLSPIWADLEVCQKGELPLLCEFRLHRPSIVFISMETWFEGRTPEVYAGYLRQIIELSLDHGAVPILATKADNVEGNHSINATIAQLAYEYDIPLWNFWLAVQPLPGHGIDWARDHEGFHITVESWNVRSFTALQALDAVWRDLNNNSIPESASTPTLMPVTSTVKPPVLSLSTSTPNPEGEQTPASEGMGRLLFSLAQKKGEKDEHSGIFLLDLTSGKVERITASGFRLLSISPDGTHLLANRGRRVWSIDVSTGKSYLLTDALFTDAKTAVTWLPSMNRVVFIAFQGGETALFLVDAEGTNISRLDVDSSSPIDLYPSPDEKQLYWEAGQCDSPDRCVPQGVRWVSLDGTRTGELPGIIRPTFSPVGEYGAYVEKDPKGLYSLHIFSREGTADRVVLESRDYPQQMIWSADGQHLLVIVVRQSSYSGRIFQYRYFLFSAPGFEPDQVPGEPLGENTNMVWSPDGRLAVFLGTRSTGNSNLLSIKLLNAEKQAVQSTLELSGLWGGQYAYLSGLAWLP